MQGTHGKNATTKREGKIPTSKSNVEDDIIAIEEISVSPRGRKAIINTELAEKLSKIPAGKAARLTGTFGSVPKDKRAKVSQSIRKHWAHVRSDQCQINYSAEGIPQVSVKPKA